MVTGVVPSSPRSSPSICIAHSVQQFHCSSDFHRALLTYAPALSASQFVHKKKSPRIYTSSMHSAGLELTKLTYTRLEHNYGTEATGSLLTAGRVSSYEFVIYSQQLLVPSLEYSMMRYAQLLAEKKAD